QPAWSTAGGASAGCRDAARGRGGAGGPRTRPGRLRRRAMADITGICNSALAKIGAARITGLAEGSRNAGLCAELYDKCRDDLLRAHSWNFAAARAKLARAAEAPAFGPAHAYVLPADWIRCVAAH